MAERKVQPRLTHLFRHGVGLLLLLLGAGVVGETVGSQLRLHSRLLGRPRVPQAVLLVRDVPERRSTDDGSHSTEFF